MKDQQSKRDVAFDKEDAYKSLDITNSWIASLDNKASIMLAYLAVMIGFVVSHGFPVLLSRSECCEFDFSNVIKIIILVALYITLSVSVVLQFLALKARTKKTNSNHSLLFFGEISEMSLNDYKSRILNRTEEGLIKDILEQIHTNSIICSRKCKLYNSGLVMTLVASALFVLCAFLKIL